MFSREQAVVQSRIKKKKMGYSQIAQCWHPNSHFIVNTSYPITVIIKTSLSFHFSCYIFLVPTKVLIPKQDALISHKTNYTYNTNFPEQWCIPECRRNSIYSRICSGFIVYSFGIYMWNAVECTSKFAKFEFHKLLNRTIYSVIVNNFRVDWIYIKLIINDIYYFSVCIQ